MTRKKQIFRIAVLAALLLAVFFGGREIYFARQITKQSLMIKLTTEELASQSEMVIQGTVVKALGARRYFDENGELMVSASWQVKPDRAFKGQLPGTLIVQTPGGRYGLTEIIVEDAAELAVGQRVLLYLKPAAEKEKYEVTGEFQGKFEVAKDFAGEEIFRQQGTGETVKVEKIIEDLAAKVE